MVTWTENFVENYFPISFLLWYHPPGLIHSMWAILDRMRLVLCFDTLRSEQNGWHFAEDILERIFLNENDCILNEISLICLSKSAVGSKSVLVQLMAWHLTDFKPFPEQMLFEISDVILKSTEWKCLIKCLICYKLTLVMVLVQEMTWCSLAASHHLYQWWQKSRMPYSVINSLRPSMT